MKLISDWKTKIAIMIEKEVYNGLDSILHYGPVESWDSSKINDFINDEFTAICKSYINEEYIRDEIDKYTCNGKWKLIYDNFLATSNGYGARGYLTRILVAILLDWNELYQKATEWLNNRVKSKYEFPKFSEADFKEMGKLLIDIITKIDGFTEIYNEWCVPNQGQPTNIKR